MRKLILGLSVLWLPIALANTTEIKMYETAKMGQGKFIGTVTATDTKYGLMLKTNLTNLTPGQHGFHVHADPNCGNMGADAGGHLDPSKTNKHLGPYTDQGHLGDLPALCVDQQGNSKTTLMVPRLTVALIQGHSLMVHSGGDNYSDTPKPLGGGGARFACGVIQ